MVRNVKYMPAANAVLVRLTESWISNVIALIGVEV
jgi:hypothetical protein